MVNQNDQIRSIQLKHEHSEGNAKLRFYFGLFKEKGKLYQL